jgi:hypothetical protein
MFGKPLFRDIPESQVNLILEDIQETLKPTHYVDNKWFADYKRLRVEAFKQQ